MVLECSHEPKESKNEKASECRSGYCFLRRRQTNVQEAHGKRADIISHCRNAHRNHSEMSFHCMSTSTVIMRTIRMEKDKCR